MICLGYSIKSKTPIILHTDFVRARTEGRSEVIMKLRALTGKSVIITCVMLLIVSSNIFPGNEPEQKSNEKIKLEQQIQPPDGEKWYEEDDEELYKFDINPVTSRTGITGGILLYYGHFIQPPYKLERKESQIYINGLRVEPGDLIFQGRVNDAKFRHMMKRYKPTNEEKRIREIETKIGNEVRKLFSEILKKYGNSSKTKHKRIEALSEYGKNNPDIEEFKIYYDPYPEFEFKVRGAKNVYGIQLRDGKDIINPIMKEIYNIKEAKEALKYWEKNLKESVIVKSISTNHYLDVKEITKVIKILDSKAKKSKKIARLYQLLGNLDTAKCMYYNLNYQQLEKWMRKNDVSKIH